MRSSPWLTAALLAGALLACSAPHRPARDDGSSGVTPDASLCGNGVIDSGEKCDEGSINGTPQSDCTKQCFPPNWFLNFVWPIPTRANLPLDVRAGAMLQLGGARSTITDFSDTGLEYVVLNADGSVKRSVPLKVHAPAIATAELRGAGLPYFAPLWLEQALPGVGGPWLFYATFDSSDTPTVHEIPYPFAEATRPELVQRGNMQPLLIDQSAMGNHDLLIAQLILHSDGTAEAVTTRLASAGLVRGALVAPESDASDPIDFAAGPPNQTDIFRIVQFYDDTRTFQTITLQSFLDSDAYTISEYARGAWPYHVVDGTGWEEMCDVENGTASYPHPWLYHPMPVAVLTDSGDIYIWQFDHSPVSGELMQPFGHVQPGSHIAMPWQVSSRFDPLPLWALQPDGSQVYLFDGDNCDVSSPALKPQIAPGVAPWSSFWSFPSPVTEGFTTDSTLHNLTEP